MSGNNEQSGDSPFAALVDDAMLELLDMANDGRTLDIRFVPGQNPGESSFLMWKPVGGEGSEEVAIREHVPDADPPEVRQVWLLGEPVRELREFISANVKSDATCHEPAVQIFGSMKGEWQ